MVYILCYMLYVMYATCYIRYFNKFPQPRCVCICIEVALRWSAHGVRCATGPGGGAHGPSKVGPMFQPREYHRSRVTHAGSYFHTVRAFCIHLSSGQLRVT